jgi:hypothetical protein
LSDEDGDSIPDLVWSSDGEVNSVQSGYIANVTVNYNAQGVPDNATVKIDSPASAYIYFTFENPANTSGITVTSVDGFSDPYYVTRNFWRNPDTPQTIHILDYQSSGEYTLFFGGNNHPVITRIMLKRVRAYFRAIGRYRYHDNRFPVLGSISQCFVLPSLLPTDWNRDKNFARYNYRCLGRGRRSQARKELYLRCSARGLPILCRQGSFISCNYGGNHGDDHN